MTPPGYADLCCDGPKAQAFDGHAGQVEGALLLLSKQDMRRLEEAETGTCSLLECSCVA
jgi:hypothetical protein